MVKKRGEISLKLEFEAEKELLGIEDLLRMLFWKDPSLASIALDFLIHIREWSRTETPYRVNDWENYCIRIGISQGAYHNMLRRLKKAGMIEKTYNESRKVHEIFLSNKFSNYAFRMDKIWADFQER